MRYTFKKNERLCSKKLIALLFTEGRSFLVYPIKVTYLIREATAYPPAQVLLLVSRKRFRKAVRRNRIKRLLREAYRLEKNYLYENLNSKQKNCLIALAYVANDELHIDEIKKSMQEVFKRIVDSCGKENNGA
ncbi:MAG: ribonuclease P protein component [Bacteroidales bacterium]